MDQLSPARLLPSAASVISPERPASRASGTRRISAVAPLHAATAATSTAGASREPTRQPSSGGAQPWQIDEPLHRWWIAVSLAVAALAGGAGPLLASNWGGQSLAVGVAMAINLYFLWQAALAWTAPHWQTRAVWHDFSRPALRRAVRLLALDVRALPRAPKNLVLFVASYSLRGAGLAGLFVSGVLGLGQQLAGRSIASPLLGLSLASASLVAVSALLGLALRLQPPRAAASIDALELAAQEFPTIVDASSALQIDSVFLQPTLLHRVLELLPSWRERVRGAGAAGHVEALQRHLWRGIPFAQIERRQRLASAPNGAAELLIDAAVLVSVEVGLDRERALSLGGRLRQQARRGVARASVVVVVETRADALQREAVDALLQSVQDALPVVIAVLPDAGR